MARNGLLFQKGFSVGEFQVLYRSEAQGEAGLPRVRSPDGVPCWPCGGYEHRFTDYLEMSAMIDRTDDAVTIENFTT